MASEEFYGDGGGSDGSGSEFDDEPFEVQSPLEKIRLVLHSFDTVNALDMADGAEFTKKRDQAKSLLANVKQLEESDMTHIEEFRAVVPSVISYAANLPTYEDDLINIYEEKLDDTENAAEKEKFKAILKQLKAHDASSVTKEDRDKVYSNLVANFL